MTKIGDFELNQIYTGDCKNSYNRFKMAESIQQDRQTEAEMEKYYRKDLEEENGKMRRILEKMRGRYSINPATVGENLYGCKQCWGLGNLQSFKHDKDCLYLAAQQLLGIKEDEK